MRARLFARSLFLLSVLGALACQNDVRAPFIFEIPEGYKGWVSVQFFRGDCPPLAQAEDGKLLARIPASGRLCAGTPMSFGDPGDEFYFVDASGQRTDAKAQIHQQHTAIEGASPGKQIYERFFVGTDEEFAKAPPEPHLE